MRFSEFEEILEDFGFVLIRTQGSHHFYRKSGVGQMSVPTKGGKMVAGVYLDQFRKLMNLDDLTLDEVLEMLG
jgi:predicted RNA binding protein YcfA (HicA-like mRNA interferase family)